MHYQCLILLLEASARECILVARQFIAEVKASARKQWGAAHENA